MRSFLKLCCSLSMLIPVTVNAQEIRPLFHVVESYSNIELGKIVGITQDKHGYIWFLDQTKVSITRFDGYRMKTYRHISGDSNSLGGVGVEALASDSSGNLWIGYANGLDKFTPRTEKFTHYYFNEGGSNSLGSNYINSILVDHSNIIWLGTLNGLDRFDPATETFTHYRYDQNDPQSLSCDIVRNVYEDRQHTIWAATGYPFDQKQEGGLNRLDQKTGKFLRYKHDEKNPNSLANDKVRAMYEDSHGNFWVGSKSNNLQILDRKSGWFKNIESDNYNDGKPVIPPANGDWDHVTFITEDRFGVLWVGLFARGVLRIDPEKKSSRLYSGDQNLVNGFSDSSTWCAFRSREGALWITTQTAKTYRLDPAEALIESLKTPSSPWSIHGDSSNLFLGFEWNGFGTIPIKNQKAELLKVHDVGKNDFGTLGINDIQPNGPGKYLMASWNGLVEFDSRANKISIPEFNNELVRKKITCIKLIPDKDGFSWYLAGLGFYVFNTRDQVVRSFNRIQNDSTSLSADTIITAHRDQSGKFWIGTSSHGINYFDVETGKATRYLKGRTVYSIAEDDKERIWAGTESGLYYKDISSADFSLYSLVTEHFKTAPISGLLIDRHKIIWGTSDKGIFRIDPVKKEFCLFGKDFGVTEIISTVKNKIWQSPEGDIYAGKFLGYYHFPTDKILNEIEPQIILTGFKIDGKAIKDSNDNILDRDIEDAGQIKLDYDQNIFSIDFAAIHFSNPEGNKVEYQLEGYENVWRMSQLEKTAYYFNIPPGDYTFRIRALSRYGIGAEKSVLILVRPPWWQTWLAYVMYFILAVIAIFGIIRWRTNSLQKDKKVLEEKVTNRTLELKKEKELVEKSLVELKAAQAQLIQSEKMASLGELTAGVAHEIQNPLNFINNFSEINRELLDELKEELESGNLSNVKKIAADLDENESKINHHGKRADSIVKGMLQHSRKSTGEKELTDINALADEYLRLAYHGLRARDKSFNAALNTDFDPTLGTVNVIPQDIGRVLLNIINNAFYAVNEKKNQLLDGYEPVVSIVSKRVDGKVSISIADNGNGIPENIKEKIFNPFFTTKPTGQGTGLGLSLSYDIIKAHGGDIQVKSVPGEGTDFTIILPT